jgi:hypothetical protein
MTHHIFYTWCAKHASSDFVPRGGQVLTVLEERYTGTYVRNCIARLGFIKSRYHSKLAEIRIGTPPRRNVPVVSRIFFA